jgi:hypothetical protein
MAVEEVRAALGSSATPASSADQPKEQSRDAQVLLKAPVSWQGIAFMGYFGFDPASKRLTSVTLHLMAKDQKAKQDLLERMGREYGASQSSLSQPDFEIRAWAHNGEQVTYTDLRNAATAVGAPAASVNFQPLASSATT